MLVLALSSGGAEDYGGPTRAAWLAASRSWVPSFVIIILESFFAYLWSKLYAVFECNLQRVMCIVVGDDVSSAVAA